MRVSARARDLRERRLMYDRHDLGSIDHNYTRAHAYITSRTRTCCLTRSNTHTYIHPIHPTYMLMMANQSKRARLVILPVEDAFIATLYMYGKVSLLPSFLFLSSSYTRTASLSRVDCRRGGVSFAVDSVGAKVSKFWPRTGSGRVLYIKASARVY